MAPFTFLREVYYESAVTLVFSVALTSVWGVSTLLQREYFPTAQKDQLMCVNGLSNPVPSCHRCDASTELEQSISLPIL